MYASMPLEIARVTMSQLNHSEKDETIAEEKVVKDLICVYYKILGIFVMHGTSHNWKLLVQVAFSHFVYLRKEHVGWTQNDLIRNCSLSDTALIRNLAHRAGFVSDTIPTAVEVLQVTRMVLAGAKSARSISTQIGLPIDRVNQIIESLNGGYGESKYGISSYGAHRAKSNGKEAVSRLVTRSGQFSYRGHLYTLGAAHHGYLASIMECKDQIRISIKQRGEWVFPRRDLLHRK